MKPAQPPPTVVRGPWRSAELAPASLEPPSRGWETLGQMVSGLFDGLDLGEILFGVVRVVFYVIIVVLHAVFHL